MQLFLTKSNNGLTLKSFVVWVLGIISRIITIYVEKLSQCCILFQCIVMATCSYRDLRDQCIFYWDILTIAIVIWMPKNTSISLAFVFIDFPLCWTLYRFVWWVICSRILPSQSNLKYCNGVISASFFGGRLNSFPLNGVPKTVGSFSLHLQTRFSFLFDNFCHLFCHPHHHR